MDISLIELGKAVVLGVVEGVTEFLPISSTGHLIVVGDWIGFGGPMAATFEIFIQLGAILSVVWLYREKIFPLTGLPLTGLSAESPAGSDFKKGWMAFWMKIFVSFLPAAVIGFFFHSYIKSHFFTSETVALALIGGGIVMLGIEYFLKKKDVVMDAERVSFTQALWIGIAQILALVPGVSRSGATIMGGMLKGLDRKTAAEFSFFLAIPTMFAATLYDLWKSRDVLFVSGGVQDILVFAIGFLVAFVSAIVAIKTFMKFISTHSFKGFAWYRIVFGVVLLFLL